MAKDRPFGVVVATFMLSTTLVACGGGEATSAASSAASTGGEATSQAATVPAESHLVVGALNSVGGSKGAALAGSTVGYDTVQDAAAALESGSVNVVVLGDADAAALYNAVEGRALVVDAVADEGDALVVSVVSLGSFSERPEEVVAYVAAHQAAVEADGGTFYRGSAMQDSVSARIKNAYAEDPARVGGELPPDNFYFLG